MSVFVRQLWGIYKKAREKRANPGWHSNCPLTHRHPNRNRKPVKGNHPERMGTQSHWPKFRETSEYGSGVAWRNQYLLGSGNRAFQIPLTKEVQMRFCRFPSRALIQSAAFLALLSSITNQPRLPRLPTG